MSRASPIWKNTSPEKARELAEKLRDNTIALYKKCAEYALSKGINHCRYKIEFVLTKTETW